MAHRSSHHYRRRTSVQTASKRRLSTSLKLSGERRTSRGGARLLGGDAMPERMPDSIGEMRRLLLNGTRRRTSLLEESLKNLEKDGPSVSGSARAAAQALRQRRDSFRKALRTTQAANGSAKDSSEEGVVPFIPAGTGQDSYNAMADATATAPASSQDKSLQRSRSNRRLSKSMSSKRLRFSVDHGVLSHTMRGQLPADVLGSAGEQAAVLSAASAASHLRRRGVLRAAPSSSTSARVSSSEGGSSPAKAKLLTPDDEYEQAARRRRTSIQQKSALQEQQGPGDTATGSGLQRSARAAAAATSGPLAAALAKGARYYTAQNSQRALQQVEWLQFLVTLRTRQALTRLMGGIVDEARRNHAAALAIQREYRAGVTRELDAAATRFRTATAAVAWKLKLQIRACRRRMAAQWAGSFFRQFGKPTFQNVVNNFRGCVRQAQVLARGWLACRRARMHALRLHWARMEEHIREEQRLQEEEKTNPNDSTTPSATAGAAAQAGAGAGRRSSRVRVKAGVREVLASGPTAEQRTSTKMRRVHERHRETQQKVDVLMAATGGIVDQLTACTVEPARRDQVLVGKLKQWRREHVRRHAARHQEAKQDWQANQDKDDMQELIEKEGPKGVAAAMGLAAERVTRPRWPVLHVYALANDDVELFTTVRSLMGSAMREQVLESTAMAANNFAAKLAMLGEEDGDDSESESESSGGEED